MLLAEAEGKARLAEATAAEGEINLRQTISELLIEAEVEKAAVIGEALKGVGQNVRIVQIGSGDSIGNDDVLLKTLQEIPEVATVISAKTQALTGETIDDFAARVARMLAGGAGRQVPGENPAATAEDSGLD
jgi:uncharacterized membrane protein YqiK